jgi:hypothetical protein
MDSIRKNPFDLTRGRGWTAAAVLTVLAVLALLTAGCGGGGGSKTGGSTSTEPTKTRTGPGPRPGPPPKTGSVLKNFNVEVVSKTEAKITLTLGKAADLSLLVKKAAGAKPEKVGRVPFGPKPAGATTINWNLKIAGKQLTPGKYEVQMRGKGGAGKSVPKTITVS